MKPGTFPFCSSCIHQAQAMAAAGHPAPCHRQFWENSKLIKPVVDANGCDGYAAVEAEQASADDPPGAVKVLPE